MTDWHDLPAGPALRVVIAERLGWHMRKVWVGSNGVEYDYLIYNNDDHLVYQRAIGVDESTDEAALTTQTWLAAVQDPDCPRWDENITEARDLVYGLDFDTQRTPNGFAAWVKSRDYVGSATTEALALARAWLAATGATMPPL